MFQLIVAALSGASYSPNIISIDDDTSDAYSSMTAGVSLNGNGSLSIYYNGSPIVVGDWITPQTNMSDYEVRATLSSGDTPDGTLGSWLSLATTKSWTLQSSSGALSSDILLEVRWTGDNSVQDSATYTLNATDAAAP